jgi:hypothetical protein
MKAMARDLRSRTDRRLTLRVAAFACIVGCFLVALDLWDHRNLFDPEGISFLDMADAYRRGDWRAALVGNWSPLYPSLLALMMLFFNPSGQWEFTAVHALNYVIYLVTLGSFSFFMTVLLRARKETDANGRLPDWSWLVFGYALFTWSIIRLIPPHQPEPDLLVCALVYLIFAMLFRIRTEAVSWDASIYLGVLLGLGYLSKGIMFPMGFVFIGIALLLAGRSAKKLYKIFVAFSVFLLLSLPYVIVLSDATGRWTFYDGGWINYAVEINQVKPWVHWQGDEPGHGTPVHPTRKIHENPALYEFGTPFNVTYPPWYDPSYWYEGIKLIPDLRQQLQVIFKNTKIFLSFFADSTGSAAERLPTWGNLEGRVRPTIGPLLSLFCLMVLMTLGRVSVFREIAAHWFALVPIAAVLGAYSLFHFQGRYIAAYVVVLWMVLFRSVAIPYTSVAIPFTEESKKIFTAVLVSAALITTITLAIGTGGGFLRAVRDFLRGDPEAPFFQSGYPNWKVAKYVHDRGVRPREPVGAVGYTLSGYWARMARVRIVAEVPAEGAMEFWSMDTASRAVVMQLFRDMGAKAVVARVGFINAQHQHEWDLQGLPGRVWPLPISAQNSTVPAGSTPLKWQYIAGTDYYVYVF